MAAAKLSEPQNLDSLSSRVRHFIHGRRSFDDPEKRRSFGSIKSDDENTNDMAVLSPLPVSDEKGSHINMPRPDSSSTVPTRIQHRSQRIRGRRHSISISRTEALNNYLAMYSRPQMIEDESTQRLTGRHSLRGQLKSPTGHTKGEIHNAEERPSVESESFMGINNAHLPQSGQSSTSYQKIQHLGSQGTQGKCDSIPTSELVKLPAIEAVFSTLAKASANEAPSTAPPQQASHREMVYQRGKMLFSSSEPQSLGDSCLVGG